MEIALDEQSGAALHTARRSLPARLRVLHIASPRCANHDLAAAIAGDAGSQILLDEAAGAVEGLERLRQTAFDAVLVSHDPPALDALALIDGLRAGGGEEPVILLGDAAVSQLEPLAYEAGADGFLDGRHGCTRSLLWLLARGVERARLLRENRRLADAEHRRLAVEHQETDRLLDQQRALIAGLESLQTGAALAVDATPSAHIAELHSLAADGAFGDEAVDPADIELAASLVQQYRELLQAYVVMGSGSLADEMRRVAAALSAGGVSAQQTMLMHLSVVEEMVRRLGSRSARHVLNRADLLVLEVIMHLAEDYRAAARRQEDF